jgi:hypothetical protein
MKRIVLLCLLVSLIVGTAYATITATATGNWSDTTTWNPASVPINDTNEVKISNPAGLTVTVNSNVGNYSTKTISIYNDATLLISGSAAAIGNGRRLAVGAGPAGSGATDDVGYLTQTGGTLTIDRSCQFAIGYRGSGSNVTAGTYLISGGTLSGVTTTAVIRVGCGSADDQTGTFNVVGTGGTINFAGDMYVANDSATASADTGLGIVKFDLVAGAVSRIKVRDSYIDSQNGLEYAVARLVVVPDIAPAGPALVLIENTSTNAVTGKFDTLNGSYSRIVNLAGSTYWLSYTYDAGTGYNNGNDIALILIPEPATIVLLAIGGLIAAKRRKQ